MKAKCRIGYSAHREFLIVAEAFLSAVFVLFKRSVSNGIKLDNQITNWDLGTWFDACGVLPWWI